MSKHSMTWRGRRLTVSIGSLIAMVLLSGYLLEPAAVDALPPRPTPAITPMPLPKAPKPMSPPLRLSHIRLLVAPAQEGLWSVVEWQGADGEWHVVDGWQGTIDGGSKRWAVHERNFGEGPFRWVVYDSPAGRVMDTSVTFVLPHSAGEELIVRIEPGQD